MWVKEAAVREAIKMMLEYINERRVIFKGDVLGVINLFEQKNYNKSLVGLIIYDILSLVFYIVDVSFNFVFREINFVVYRLFKWVITNDTDKV